MNENDSCWVFLQGCRHGRGSAGSLSSEELSSGARMSGVTHTGATAVKVSAFNFIKEKILAT